MEITRKDFMASLTTALMAATALPTAEVFAGVASAPTGPKALALGRLIGSSFELSLPGGVRQAMVLRELVPRKSCPRTEQFSLIFNAEGVAALPRNVYPVSHPQMGNVRLVMASMTEKSGLRADFNLLRA